MQRHHLPRPCAGRPTATFVAVPALLRAPSLLRRRHATAPSRRAAVPPRDGENGDGESFDNNGGKKNDNGDNAGDNSGTAPPPPPAAAPRPRRTRPSSRDTASALEALRGHADKKIGAEYGEGFVQLGPSGEAERLDVDALNERLRPSGALRLRRSLLAPDEAHAALFSFEGVIADTRAAQAAAWASVAAERGLAWPPPEATTSSTASSSSFSPLSSLSSSSLGNGSSEEPPLSPRPSPVILPPRVALVCSLRPERAVTEVLRWTGDWALASRIAADVAHAYVDIVRGEEFCMPRPGVARWLSALRSARVPAAVVTSLDRRTLLAALKRMGLLGNDGSGNGDDLMTTSSSSSSSSSSSPFSSFVTAEDGAESLAHSLLAAALKLARPPNACCAFVSSPAGVAAAHNASMRAVAVLHGDRFGAHELRSADATVARLDELRVIQLRRLFAATGGGEGVGVGGGSGGAGEGDVGGMPRQKERVDGGGSESGGVGDFNEKGWRGRRERPRGVAGGLMDRPEEEGGGGEGAGGRRGR